MRPKWWVALVPAMALAGGACSTGSSSNGPDGGAGHAPTGTAGTRGAGGTGNANVSGNAGATGHAGVSGNAGATGHGAAGDGAPGGQAGGGAGAGGATSGGAGAGGAGPGGAGGQAAHPVTFAFTGHVTSLSVAVDPTNDTTPRVGDTFTGSYTINANTPLQANGADPQGSFIETEPGIVADLEIHNLSYSLPTPDDRNYVESYVLIAPGPTTCWIVVGYFAEPRTIPDFDYEGHMDFYWNLINPTGPVPTAKDLTTVPPVLSDWTQGPAAVSIELKGTYHSDYVADGVIDTIVAR